MLFKEEAIILHIMYVWENNLLHSAVIYSKSLIYFLFVWGQFYWESRGHDVWQWAKWERVITTAKEFVFVSVTALESKANYSCPTQHCCGLQNIHVCTLW